VPLSENPKNLIAAFAKLARRAHSLQHARIGEKKIRGRKSTVMA
jgi:hypothetical protein